MVTQIVDFLNTQKEVSNIKVDGKKITFNCKNEEQFMGSFDDKTGYKFYSAIGTVSTDEWCDGKPTGITTIYVR